MAVLHRLHARSRRPGAGALARRAYGCLWLSPRLARGHTSSRRLEPELFREIVLYINTKLLAIYYIYGKLMAYGRWRMAAAVATAEATGI